MPLGRPDRPGGPSPGWVLLAALLALLVGNTAGSLAGRLAGSLALTATAVLGAVAQATSLESLDSFHNMYLQSVKF